MKTRVLCATLFVAFGLLAVGQVFAHHGTAAYDTTKAVTVKGAVTEFEFVNPHVLVFLEVKDDKAAVQKWQGELTSPNHLERVGWTKSSLKPGDKITLSGYPAKSGAASMWITKVVLADGTALDTGIGN